MKFIKKYSIEIRYCLAILILIIPQVVSKQVILGSDSLFHFNRFYDTGMQIKEGNWQYFISMYGFQSSGRIITPLYGPIIAYLHGGLLMLTGTWFRYQVMSNLLLFCIGFFSMNQLLKYNYIEKRLRYRISFFFITTFVIQYWILRQGFSSWGGALLPLCLIPIRRLVLKEQLSVLPVAISIAGMVQTHLFTSLILVSIYFFVYSYVWITGNSKLNLLKQLVVSVLLFLIFSANILLGMYEVYSQNQLIQPFVNHQMYLSTINFQSIYWLLTPASFLIIILITLKNFKKTPDKKLTRIVGWTSFIYFILSTNLVPWKFLSEQSWTLIELIQFPFRFFIPFTVLFCLFWGLIQQDVNKYRKLDKILLLMSIVQTVLICSFHIYNQVQTPPESWLGKHGRFEGQEVAEIQASFHSYDLKELLRLINKSTPDYLPWYQDSSKNKYELYREEIIENDSFNKQVEKGNLIYTWTAEKEETKVPVIVYSGTKLILNNHLLDTNNLKLSAIGVPKVPSKKGVNQLEISFPSTTKFNYLFLFVLVLWGSTGVLFLWKIIKKSLISPQIKDN